MKINEVCQNSLAAFFTLAMIASSTTANAGNEALLQVSKPIPVTTTSRPFLEAGAEMAAVGYVEEEFFLSGYANVYDREGEDKNLKIVAGPGKYTTRILVRRPRDPAKFSGNVEMTILNATYRVDAGGMADFGGMVKRGDVWMGLRANPSRPRR